MDLSSPVAAMRRPAPAARHAFAGLSWQSAACAAALCATWAFGSRVHDLLGNWRGGTILPFLLLDVPSEFGCTVAIALGMGLPLLAVGNLGPADGWRRIAALVLAIAVVSPLGSLIRVQYFQLTDDFSWSAPAAEIRVTLIRLTTRYAMQAALLTAVAEFRRRERRSLRAMHQAEVDRDVLGREMAQARLQVLQAQIEPHFLFNTLANVRRLYQTDRARGRRMMADLMRYLRIALPCMRRPSSNVGDELALAVAYLELQRIRMGERLRVEIDVPDATTALELPPMVLLTLVENAIKHGLHPQPQGGTIRIEARVAGDTLWLEVRDDGAGLRQASGAGTGLANIRARLQALHGDAARLRLSPDETGGVRAVLALPARRMADEPRGEA